MNQVGQKKSMILSQKQFLYFEKIFYGKNLRYLINSAIGLLQIEKSCERNKQTLTFLDP